RVTRSGVRPLAIAGAVLPRGWDERLGFAPDFGGHRALRGATAGARRRYGRVVRQRADRSRACLTADSSFAYKDLQTGALRTPSSCRHIFTAVIFAGRSRWPGVARPTRIHSSSDGHAWSVGTA